MNWTIESHKTDTYEISPTDTQHEYTIYVKNEMGVNVDGALAYGIEDRTKVTNLLLTRHELLGYNNNLWRHTNHI